MAKHMTAVSPLLVMGWTICMSVHNNAYIYVYIYVLNQFDSFREESTIHTNMCDK